MKHITYYQQGDILLFPVQEIPANATEIKGHNNVLAEGESTGHAHRMAAPVQLFRNAQQPTDVFMAVPKRIELRHEEHATQVIPPGKYRIGRVQEYDYSTQEARRVQD